MAKCNAGDGFLDELMGSIEERILSKAKEILSDDGNHNSKADCSVANLNLRHIVVKEEIEKAFSDNSHPINSDSS
jgi:hypothetical protein